MDLFKVFSTTDPVSEKRLINEKKVGEIVSQVFTEYCYIVPAIHSSLTAEVDSEEDFMKAVDLAISAIEEMHELSSLIILKKKDLSYLHPGRGNTDYFWATSSQEVSSKLLTTPRLTLKNDDDYL